NRLQLEMWLRCVCGLSLRAAMSSIMRWRSGLTVVMLLIESSILSEVDDTAILRTGLSTPLLLILSTGYRPLGSCPRAAGWSAATLCSGPTPTTSAVQQVVGCLGYSGRDADVVVTPALDPKPSFNGRHHVAPGA